MPEHMKQGQIECAIQSSKVKCVSHMIETRKQRSGRSWSRVFAVEQKPNLLDFLIMTANRGENVVSTIQDCQNGISIDLFLHLSLIPAVFIVGVLSFLQRRANRLPIDHRLPILKGRFGIVVPLDTIGSLSNRWSYGFAFGAVSSSVLLLFSEQYIPFTVPTWARAIVYLVGAIEVGLVYFPFFACLSTSFKTTGAVLGILYSLAWILVTVWNSFTCPNGKVLGKYQKIIVGPASSPSSSSWDPEELTEQHQVHYVKRLLRKTPEHSKPLSWFQSRVYEWDPYFKFPNRIIGTAIISIIGLYTVLCVIQSLGRGFRDLGDVTNCCGASGLLCYQH